MKIKNLETKLNNLNESREKKEDMIEKFHLQWFPKLQEFSALLNSNFQKFLTLFGCRGLIELDIGVTRVSITYLPILLLPIFIILICVFVLSMISKVMDY